MKSRKENLLEQINNIKDEYIFIYDHKHLYHRAYLIHHKGNAEIDDAKRYLGIDFYESTMNCIRRAEKQLECLKAYLKAYL